MFDNPEQIQEKDNTNDDNGIGIYRRPVVHAEKLSREMKRTIRKNIHNWPSVENLIAAMSPEELIEVEQFLWDEATAFATNTLQEKLAREYITMKMEPTAVYHRRQMCGEPLTACRANYCIHSNPNCAGHKLRQNIKAIAAVFDRRGERSAWRDKALSTFLQRSIGRHHLLGVILTSESGAPIAAQIGFDRNSDPSSSDFVKTFFSNLDDYIDRGSAELQHYQNLSVKACSQRVQVDDGPMIITLLTIHDTTYSDVMQEVSRGIGRIFHSEPHAYSEAS